MVIIFNLCYILSKSVLLYSVNYETHSFLLLYNFVYYAVDPKITFSKWENLLIINTCGNNPIVFSCNNKYK